MRSTTLMLRGVIAAGIVSWTMTQVATADNATPGDGFSGIWYEIASGGGDYPNKYGGGLATYPQQVGPMAIYRPEVEKTFFAFSMDIDPGPGRNIGHALSYYDHVTGQVARPQVWIPKGTTDAHDAPALSMDDDGYIYLFSATHGESRESFISKSQQPYGLDAFDSLLSPQSPEDMAVFGNPPQNPGSSGNPRFSYPTTWYVPNAQEDEKFLLLHTRYQSGQRDLFTTTSADGDTWTERKSLAQIESGQYQYSWIKPDGETVGTIFNVHPTGLGLNHRTDLYYFETSDQAQTWQTVDGLTLVDNSGSNNNPFTSRPDGPGTGAALAYDAADGELVYLKDINYDSAGRPIIMFLTSPSSVPGDHGEPGPDRFVKTAHWTGREWRVRDVTTTDHNYDYGSLYVEPDGTWRVIGPFLDGPQGYGTGGEIGMWTSSNQGLDWTLDAELTSDSNYNHTYVQRPLNAHEDFYGFWADGDAFEQSSVHLYFTNKQGEVFHLPFETDTAFVTPEPYATRPIEITPSISGIAPGGVIESITVTGDGGSRQYAIAQLHGAHLTAFGGKIEGNGRIADIIVPSGTPQAPDSQDRPFVISDGRADTAFVNLDSWSVAFDVDVVNQEGADIILLDWGGADTVDIAIGGVTIDDAVPISSNVFGETFSNRIRYQSNETSVDTLGELLAATFHLGPTTGGTSTGYAIDLSDFGFGHGAVFEAGQTIDFSDGQGIDPTEIYALPTDDLAGDFNNDGTVDAADYVVWRNGLGGLYSEADYIRWKSNFGATNQVGELNESSSNVPTPASISLLVLAMLVARIQWWRYDRRCLA